MEKRKEGGGRDKGKRYQDFIAMHGMSIRNLPYKRFRPILGPIAGAYRELLIQADA